MWNYLPNQVVECCERLKKAQIENIDAVKLISRYSNPDTLIYCDPPYMQELRKKNIYKYEMSTDDHVELLATVLDSKSKVILSGYDNDLYNDMLKGWRTDEKATTAQMGLHRVEKIWMNY